MCGFCWFLHLVRIMVSVEIYVVETEVCYGGWCVDPVCFLGL